MRQKFALLMIFVSCACLLLVGLRDILSSKALAGGSKTKGEIQSVRLHRGGRSGKSYRVSFSFTVDDKVVEGHDSLSVSEGSRLKVGQAVPVVYEEGRPETGALGTPQSLWRERGRPSMLWALVLGLVGTVGIAGYVVRDLRKA